MSRQFKRVIGWKYATKTTIGLWFQWFDIQDEVTIFHLIAGMMKPPQSWNWKRPSQVDIVCSWFFAMIVWCYVYSMQHMDIILHTHIIYNHIHVWLLYTYILHYIQRTIHRYSIIHSEKHDSIIFHHSLCVWYPHDFCIFSRPAACALQPFALVHKPSQPMWQCDVSEQ
jgi:hypothetical protein